MGSSDDTYCTCMRAVSVSNLEIVSAAALDVSDTTGSMQSTAPWGKSVRRISRSDTEQVLPTKNSKHCGRPSDSEEMDRVRIHAHKTRADLKLTLETFVFSPWAAMQSHDGGWMLQTDAH